MSNKTYNGLTAIIGVCGLLLYSLPSFALQANSGNLRPVKGTPMVYESYISKDGCKQVSDYSPAFSGVASVYLSSSKDPFLGKPMKISCPEGYAVVDMDSQTSGAFVAGAGGQINNNSTLNCCPIKHRWTPVTKASA